MTRAAQLILDENVIELREFAFALLRITRWRQCIISNNADTLRDRASEYTLTDRVRRPAAIVSLIVKLSTKVHIIAR